MRSRGFPINSFFLCCSVASCCNDVHVQVSEVDGCKTCHSPSHRSNIFSRKPVCPSIIPSNCVHLILFCDVQKSCLKASLKLLLLQHRLISHSFHVATPVYDHGSMPRATEKKRKNITAYCSNCSLHENNAKMLLLPVLWACSCSQSSPIYRSPETMVG